MLKLMLRYCFFLLLTMIPFSLFSGGNTIQAPQTPPVSTEKAVRLSFIQTADAALLKAIPNRSNQYALFLFNIDPYITFLSVRPNRITQLTPLENFIKAWSIDTGEMPSFEKQNPNAIIVATNINGQPNKNGKTYLVTLSEPRYDNKQNQMTYLVKSLQSDQILLSQVQLDDVTIIIN